MRIVKSPHSLAAPKKIALQIFAMLLSLASFCISSSALAQLCSVPGFNGPNAALSGAVNTYFAGAALGASGSTVNMAATARAEGAAAALAVGDMVLIMQMQGADINASDTAQYGDGQGAAFSRQDNTVPALPAPSPTVAYNALTNATDGYAGGVNGVNYTAGLYEYAVVTQVISTSQIRVRGAAAGGNLRNTYTQAAGPNQRSYQVIRVPQYASANITGNLVAPPWDGNTGGVVAIDVAGELNFAANIDVSQQGFRGGGVRNIAAQTTPQIGGYRDLYATDRGGMKGEGVAGTPARIYSSLNNVLSTVAAADGYVNGDIGRGAPGNAGGGGNQHNAGGGGGGNGGAGGNGGGSWNVNTNDQSGYETGGFGGFPIGAGTGPARMFLGGGGGAGDVGGNGSTDPQGSGSSGGGIVMVRAGSITGAGSIASNGGSAPNVGSTDAAGGGGAGGSILVSVQNGSVAGLGFSATGGNGGSNNMGAGNPEQDGPGGGGGGGVVYTPAGNLGTITPGVSGQVTTANTTPTNAPFYYARGGATGVLPTVGLALDTTGSRAGFECLPQLTVGKNATPSLISLATGATATYSIGVANGALSGGVTNLSIFDETLPPGWTLAASPTVTYAFAPATSATFLGGGAESIATQAGNLPNNAATSLATSFPLRGASVPPDVAGAAGQNSLRWGSFFLDQGESMTITFTVNIPDSAPVGTYHNPAGISYLDPTRVAAAPNRLITPTNNNGANRLATNYSSNTTHASGPTSAVVGSNYSGLQAGPGAEDIRLIADLSISKAGPATIAAGATAAYTLSPRNNGRGIGTQTFSLTQASDVSAANVPSVLGANPLRVTDTLPAGLSLAGTPTGTNWTCTGSAGSTGTFTCDYFQASPANAYPLSGSTTLPVINVPVQFANSACPGPPINTATISLTPNEVDTANNTSNSVSTTLNCNATLTVAKTDGTNTVAAGGTTVYTVTYGNLGPAAGDGAIVRDVASAGLSCTVINCLPSSGPPAAVCPAPALWPNFLTAGGVALPSLPAGSNIQWVVRCGVSASGS